MNKRPLAVTIIGCLFIVTGLVGVAYHATEFKLAGPFPYETVLICAIRMLAIVGGIFLLRAHNWARWLVVLWMAYHVALSALHTISQVVVHGLFLAVMAYFLFQRSATAYFKSPPLSAKSDEGN